MKRKTVLFILLFLNLYGLTQINLNNGLIAKYYFNGNANDESGNLNNGTVNGATLTTDRFGFQNSAYSFNGFTSRITVNSSSSLNISSSISICVWFKTFNPGVGATGGTMVAKMKTLGSRQYYLMALDSIITGDSLYYCLVKSNDSYLRPAVHGNYWDNKWHFLVGTYDYTSGQMKIYVDNQLLKTSNVGSFYLEQSAQPLTIGCYVGLTSGYRDYFNGDLDDIRIYNRAINASEVDALFHENDCSTLSTVSISGLSTTYTTNDPPVTLSGNPNGGTFFGPGIFGNIFNPNIAGIGTHNIVYVFTNNYGCSSVDCETVNILLTNKEENKKKENNVSIYPNPGSTFLEIQTDIETIKTIEIINFTGQLVKKMKFNNYINISDLAIGIYVINFSNKKGDLIKTEKFIKQ